MASQVGPRPDMSVVKVAWGATEGGRDRLQWVRQLIRFTETHPLLIPPPAAPTHQPAAEPMVEAELVSGAAGERGIKQQVFPSAHPTRRQDIQLLAHWLTETLKHLQDNLPQVCLHLHLHSAWPTTLPARVAAMMACSTAAPEHSSLSCATMCTPPGLPARLLVQCAFNIDVL